MIPIGLIEGNRVYDIHGNPYAIYVVPKVSYAFISSVKKTSVINEIEHALRNRADELCFNLLCKQLSIKQVGKEMAGFSSDEGWQEQIKFTLDELKKVRSFERINFLVIPLKKREIQLSGKYSSKDTAELFSLLFKDIAHKIRMGIEDVVNKFSRQEFQIYTDVLDAHERQTEELTKSLESLFIGIRPATIHETEWWLKKGYYRGIEDPELKIPYPFPVQVISKGNKTAIRPIRTSLLSITEGVVRESMNHLEVVHSDNNISYQTFMTSLNVPTNIPANDPIGNEWMYGVLEKFDFPIDVALRIRFEPYIEAREKASRQNKIAKSQVREYRNSETDDATFGQSSVPEELLDNLEDYDSLRQKFRVNQQSLAYVTTVFGFGADHPDELQRRVEQFIPVAQQYDHALITPTSNMLKMFQSFYPFSNDLPGTWELPMDPGVVAAAVPFGVRVLGDPIGAMLGYLLPGRPIFINPPRPMMELNRSGAMLICGTLGAGKTLLMKYINYILLIWGGHCFANDPKGDWAWFCEHPRIKPISLVLAFTPNSDTIFTPFRLGTDNKACYETAFGILELILNPKGDESRNLVIMDAINKVQQTNQWDMEMFTRAVNYIRKEDKNLKMREQAEFILRKVEQLPNHPIGRMIFGKDNGKDMFKGKRMICAITRGLQLPGRSQKKDDWTENERLSVAMMYAICTLALRYLTSLPSGTLKGLSWEEFWYLKEFDQGKKVYNESLRLSRSEKMVVIMASQNPTDAQDSDEASDDITGLFGWKFMLRLQSKIQVGYALKELMDIDENPDDWMETFSEMYCNGKGLVKDPEGRVGEVQVKILDPLLMKHLQSTPS